MRAFRIVLVLKSAKGIRSLFQTLLLSIAPAVNITVLLLLLYSLYAILGMQLFGTAPLQVRRGPQLRPLRRTPTAAAS